MSMVHASWVTTESMLEQFVIGIHLQAELFLEAKYLLSGPGLCLSMVYLISLKVFFLFYRGHPSYYNAV